MTVLFYFLSLVIILLCYPPATKTQSSSKVGISCTQRNGQEGVCGNYNSCIKDFAGDKPKVCSYEQQGIVVCCDKKTDNSWKGMAKKTCSYYKYLASKKPSIGFLNLDNSNSNNNIPLCSRSIPLIVNGILAKPQEFPHFASIGFIIYGKREFKCGGSLISERFVLTAGHCISDSFGNVPSFVRLGDLDLTTTEDDKYAKDYDIEKFIKHPDYKPSKDKYNDIALIKLVSEVTFTAYIRPACLSLPNDDVIEGNRTIAIGQGALDTSESSSNILYKVTLDIKSNAFCSTHYRKNTKLPQGLLQSQICAGSMNGDTCTGDSGGPIQIIDSDDSCMYYIVGVTSFGKVCGGLAAIYTRVTSYIEWIEKTVWS